MDEDKRITTIQNLLTRASHSETPEGERQSCISKADELMAKYRIDRAMLNFEHKDKARPIVSREVPMEFEEYTGVLKSICFSVYIHAGCQVNSAWRMITVVGYDEDITFGTMLWSNIYMDFVSKMFPTWDEWRTFDSNVQRIKDSGRSWMEIVNLAPVEAGLSASSGSKLRNAYKAEYKRLGIEPAKAQTRTPAKFRNSFADSFDATIRDRLARLKYDSEGCNVTLGYEVALQTDEDRVKAAFYDMFPGHRPMTAEERAARSAESQARFAAADEAERLRREGMTQKQRDAEDARARRENAKLDRWYRAHAARNAYDDMGYAAGKNAADSVNLSRGNTVGRNDRELA